MLNELICENEGLIANLAFSEKETQKDAAKNG
jgi:hypothetical protein